MTEEDPPIPLSFRWAFAATGIVAGCLIVASIANEFVDKRERASR